MSNAKNIINRCWNHLLDFKAKPEISDTTSFIYAFSIEMGVAEVNNTEGASTYYMSSYNLNLDGYQSEAFFEDRLHLCFSSTADPSAVQFLRDYWVLITYIKMKPANEVFLISHMAQSLDGKVCTNTGHSKWIGNDANLIHAHRLRAIVDGVVVGGNTAKADLPKLTVRHVDGQNPVRIIFSDNFDNYQNLPTADGQKTINIRSHSATIAPDESRTDVEYYSSEDQHYLKGVLTRLNAKGIKSILVEGGPATASSFLTQGLVDLVQLHIAPIILGSGKSSFDFMEIEEIQEATKINGAYYSTIGDAQMITGIPFLSASLKFRSNPKSKSVAIVQGSMNNMI